MKGRKEGNTQLREQMKDFKINPSANAWPRLQSMLERQTLKGRRIRLYRWVAVAAAVLVAFSLFFWENDLPNFSPNADSIAVPQSLEELQISDDCQPYCLLLRVRSELPDYYANPLEKHS